MNLTNQLYDYLYDCGAALVGVADMSMDKNITYPRAISVAIPVPVDIVRSLKTAPTKAYYNTYNEMNDRLNRIVINGAKYLIDKGYHAVAMTTDVVQLDREKWISNFPHKTAATRAGLGWIGKNCLLVTPQYGSAVRLSSILTDAPIQTADAITKSRCGNCTLCVKSCPAEALSGTLWEAGMERSELFDEWKCYHKQVQIMLEQTGIKKDLCGKCFAVCAFTQKYISE